MILSKPSEAQASCEIPNLQELLRYICEHGFEHHVAANFSRTAALPSSEADHEISRLAAFTGTDYMSIVAGVDFGTLSVRVSIVDSERGRLGAGVSEYPLHRKREDPDHATQSHADHMRALIARRKRRS